MRLFFVSVVMCSYIPLVRGGSWYITGYRPGNMARLNCAGRAIPRGQTNIVCEENGAWNVIGHPYCNGNFVGRKANQI